MGPTFFLIVTRLKCDPMDFDYDFRISDTFCQDLSGNKLEIRKQNVSEHVPHRRMDDKCFY